MRDLGCSIVKDEDRAKHLFGVLLPQELAKDISRFSSLLKEHNVCVSLRGPAVRVSLHIYNNMKDIQALVSTIRKMIHG